MNETITLHDLLRRMLPEERAALGGGWVNIRRANKPWMVACTRQRSALLGGGLELHTAQETLTPGELWLVERLEDRHGNVVWPVPPEPVLPPTPPEV